jgi:hypothetical protein
MKQQQGWSSELINFIPLLVGMLWLSGCSDQGDEITIFPSMGGEETVIIVHEPTEADCPPRGQGQGRGPCR